MTGVQTCALPISYASARVVHQAGRPAAFILFYRSLLEGGQTAPVDALCAALDREGLNAHPLFIASLKDAASVAAIAGEAATAAPAVAAKTVESRTLRIIYRDLPIGVG